jgi:hypothetical protein
VAVAAAVEVVRTETAKMLLNSAKFGEKSGTIAESSRGPAQPVRILTSDSSPACAAAAVWC